jgi:cyclophilin family peptidyl-prolyl cis-trans isomerase
MYARSLAALAMSMTLAGTALAANPNVRMSTSLGDVEIELYADKAPASVKNFLGYVDSGFYNGTVFHRVIPNFMIQGGGFEPGMKQKETGAPIQNEADNGLKNTLGTLAMARTMDPHSASAQFFINVADNEFLNHRAKNARGWGYAVFGKVTKGMDVVMKIAGAKTGPAMGHDDVPVKDVVIKRMEAVKP